MDQLSSGTLVVTDTYDCCPWPPVVAAPFKLSKAGQTLRLYDASGTEIDRVSYPSLQDNIAYGRESDGCGAFVLLEAPSPGRPNTALLPSGESPRTRCLMGNNEQEDTAAWRRTAEQSTNPAQVSPLSPPVPCASGADDCGCVHGVSGWSTSLGACADGSSTSRSEAANCRNVRVTGDSTSAHATDRTSTDAPQTSGATFRECDADVSSDGMVNVQDLLLVLSAFGMDACGGDSTNARFDFDGSCRVDVGDLLLALPAFGATC